MRALSAHALGARASVAEARYLAWPRVLLAIISIGIAYGLVFAGIRLAISENLTLDDATANILAQTLELGYKERQPPLYEWLLWSVQRVTGPELVSFLLVKYALLTATFAFLYLAATRLFADWRWQVMAALSPLLLYQIGWNAHEGVTHTMVMTCAVAASFWAFMRLIERCKFGDYLLFGLIAGLGLLSKYGFAAYLLILFACACLQPVLRARLVDWRMLAGVGTAGAVCAPFVYWLLTGHHDLVAVFDKTVAREASDRLMATASGLWRAVYAPIGFLLPLLVVLLIAFPGMLRPTWGALRQSVAPHSWDRHSPDWSLLLLHMTLAGFAFLMLGTLLTGASNYLERYMHPFFLLTPLWLLTMVERSGRSERKVLVLAAIFAAVTAAVAPVRAINLLKDMAPHCDKCRTAIPYEGLAAALRARGIKTGTIIVADRVDGGNLRRFLPTARIVCLRFPTYAPPARPQDLSSPSAVVWAPAKRPGLPKGAEVEFSRLGSTVGASQKVRVPWTPLGAESAERSWPWMVAVAVPSGALQK